MAFNSVDVRVDRCGMRALSMTWPNCSHSRDWVESCRLNRGFAVVRPPLRRIALSRHHLALSRRKPPLAGPGLTGPRGRRYSPRQAEYAAS